MASPSLPSPHSPCPRQVLRLRSLRGLPPAQLNRLTADVMAQIAAVLRLGESSGAVAAGCPPLDADSRDRMAGCLRTLAGADEGLEAVWLQGCHDAFAELIADKQQREAAEAKQEVRGCMCGGASRQSAMHLACTTGSLLGLLPSWRSRSRWESQVLTSTHTVLHLPHSPRLSRRPRRWRSQTS